MQIAEVVVPAVVLALLGGTYNAFYLVCAGVVRLHRRRNRVRLSRSS
jgi:hypothetical protein